MNKLLSIFILSLLTLQLSKAQVLCVQCYQQNDSISANVTNLTTNGSFENHNCVLNYYPSTYCPNSSNFSCSLSNWTCTGGGSSSYPNMFDANVTVVPNGISTAYLGNGSNAGACSSAFNDTSCIADSGCVVIGIPSNYPSNDVLYGGTTGVSISQTVNGLTPGFAYVLEFWAGGEKQSSGWTKRGVFAVNVGFGNIYLRCKPTQPPNSIGTRYLIQFIANSTSHTIKFTNWGHICIQCTEVILDDVRLYSAEQLPTTVTNCAATSGINNQNGLSAEIFPNPATDELTIKSSQPNLSTIVISDLLSHQLIKQQFSGSTVLNIANFSKGVYVFVITDDAGHVKKGKLIKE